MQDNAVESISGCSYERICDAGMEISVGGKKRLLPVDTVVICAGKCIAAAMLCARARSRLTPPAGQEPLRDLEAGLKAKNASVWCIGGAEVAAELDAKRAIDQGDLNPAVLSLLYWGNSRPDLIPIRPAGSRLAARL